jgi:Zn-finger nucleic acid-binding protein
VAGILLATLGLAFTATVAAVVSVAGVLLMLAIREREGERILPWSAGQASQVTRAEASFKSVMKAVNQVLWSRISLIVMGVMFFDGLIYGYGQALMPFAAVNVFGYTSAQWSQLVAAMGMVGAVLTLGLGPLIDRAGAKSMLLFTVALVGVHAFTLSQTQHLWENTLYVRTMLSIYVVMLPIVMVASLALAMAICSGPVSATQFAIYMSVANLGHTVGSKIYGIVAEQSSYVQSYAMMSALVVAMIVVLVFYRHAPASDDDDVGGRKPKRHATVGVAGAGAVAFWSGAIRCPKCRSDMELLVYEGVEIDRCQYCKGLWFDAGEIQALKRSEAAAELDIGSASVGRSLNSQQDYDCPRCAGPMEQTADARQPHIHFETCRDCGGSFLDAGELTDLAELTPGEVLRSLLPGKRTAETA